MIKRLLAVLCVIVVMFSIEKDVDANPINQSYNNEEKVTQISYISDKELYTIPGECFFWGSYVPYRNREYIVNTIGAEPYWRKGKEDMDYAIYKTDSIHYLIVTSYRDSFLDRWYVSKIPSKILFEKYVKKGTAMNVVELIDPDIIEGNRTYPEEATTYHKFDDGTYKVISYIKDSKGQFIVDTIFNGKDDVPVFQNILDIDYQLIKNDNPNEEAEFLEKLKRLNEKPKKDDVIKLIRKKPTRVKIQSAKRIKKKSIRIQFKKAKYAKKYQIQYASNKKFKKAKIKTIKKNYYTIKASGKKTFYIRVRGVNGTKKGAWSKTKKIKKISKQQN